MGFVKSSTVRSTPESPELLYRDLPKRPDGISGLWAHQADMLREYLNHIDKADLALELPTGTGKTLVGLLIAEWTRLKYKTRVLYACPTVQLVHQVASTAQKEGIKTSVLVGKYQDWPILDQNNYTAGDAVGITTYSSIFNSNPKVEPADLILFDDAHAGEQYVGEQYGIRINHKESSSEYGELLEVLKPALGEIIVERLMTETTDSLVRLVVPCVQPGMVLELDKALASFGPPHSFQYSMIKDNIDACLIYVSYPSTLIRSFVPQTTNNVVFSSAKQRIYLSAVLGSGGELERAFGRKSIFRLTLPDEAASPRSGRRFFVFPQLVSDDDSLELSKKIVKLAGKALVIAPDTKTTNQISKNLTPPEWSVMSIDDVRNGMDPFTKKEHAVCGLAARYDGLDLPGKTCQAVVLGGKPNQANLQERFLAERARSEVAFAERVRTRIIQGAGRCTRGPNDIAAVVIFDLELTKYLGQPEVVKALDLELQAEIKFGKENSTNSSDVLSNVEAFLAQNDEWRNEAEPNLNDYRLQAVKTMPEGTEALAESVEDEITAWSYASSARWSDASQYAQKAALTIGKGGDKTRGYRAFWLYLAAIWSYKDTEATKNGNGKVTTRDLMRQAENAAGIGSWIQTMAPLPTEKASNLSRIDANAVQRIVKLLEKGINQGKHNYKVKQMNDGLAQSSPPLYEVALTILGGLVGAISAKPVKQGRCDSTWCWDDELWIAVEAKSAHVENGVIPLKDIRQSNDQLRLLAKDRNLQSPPNGSAVIIISPKLGVHDDAKTSAEPHVYLAHLEEISKLAKDVTSAWEKILSQKHGQDLMGLTKLVSDIFSSYNILPTQVTERLTKDLVNHYSKDNNDASKP